MIIMPSGLLTMVELELEKIHKVWKVVEEQGICLDSEIALRYIIAKPIMYN